MILTDGTNTLTTNFEDVSASNVINGNTEVTIGGMVKSQADSRYLKITSVVMVSEADYLAYLIPIMDNFTAAKYYTPPYALPGKAAADEIEVVIESVEKIDEGDREGTTVFYVKIQMSEVLTGAT